MHTRQELEMLIRAWPDKNGISSDPDTFNDWVDKERKHFVRFVRQTLGFDRLKALSEKQRRLLDKSLEELLQRKSLYDMTEEEILGQYEMITVYVAPIELEIAWKVFVKNKTKH